MHGQPRGAPFPRHLCTMLVYGRPWRIPLSFLCPRTARRTAVSPGGIFFPRIFPMSGCATHRSGKGYCFSCRRLVGVGDALKFSTTRPWFISICRHGCLLSHGLSRWFIPKYGCGVPCCSPTFIGPAGELSTLPLHNAARYCAMLPGNVATIYPVMGIHFHGCYSYLLVGYYVDLGNPNYTLMLHTSSIMLRQTIFVQRLLDGTLPLLALPFRSSPLVHHPN